MKHIKTDKNTSIKLYKKYYQELTYGIDGYHERMIVDGDSYLLFDNDINVGIFSVHEERGWTGFYIHPEYRNNYSNYFSYVLSTSLFDKMMFSTRDTILFDEVTSRGYETTMQAYNFKVGEFIDTDYQMELATLDRVDEYKKVFDNFIKDYNKEIENKQLYIKYDGNNNPICLGGFEPMILPENKACVYMKVAESHRRQGHGVNIVKFMIRVLKEQGIEANARCWYQNTNSRKTLNKSGFVESNLLIRVLDLK